jgi:hypothetical protein
MKSNFIAKLNYRTYCIISSKSWLYIKLGINYFLSENNLNVKSNLWHNRNYETGDSEHSDQESDSRRSDEISSTFEFSSFEFFDGAGEAGLEESRTYSKPESEMPTRAIENHVRSAMITIWSRRPVSKKTGCQTGFLFLRSKSRQVFLERLNRSRISDRKAEQVL